jgi:hypothetical protein
MQRIREAWNAFRSEDVLQNDYRYGMPQYGGQSPSRPVTRFSNERSIISSIYTRIAIDVSDVIIRHVENDGFGRYQKDVASALNGCLSLQPNLDQGPRAFRQDIVATMFDEGVAAVVPIDTVTNPNTSDVFDVYSMRVGRVVTWYPQRVRVSCYNEKTGKREDVTLSKDFVALIENPLFEVMNQPNSTLQRLIRKLNLLDIVDEQSSSGKLDIIIQLPYTIRSEARREQANQRRNDIEFQLKGSQYGIAYADATEKITQLNRPAENNLLKQIEMLVEMLYGQLGLTPDVMNGTADEATMNNYYHRTVKPIADAIVESMSASFISNAGIARNERVVYFRDPFKFVPMEQIAEIADKFTRNEIATANEIRGAIGMPPHPDPKADELANSNMPADKLVNANPPQPEESPVA